MRGHSWNKALGLLAAAGMGCGGVAWADVSIADRQNAAATAAGGASCQNLNFYWEIGDRSGKRGSGNGPAGTAASQVQPTDQGPIASAGKWLYAAYVLERTAGAVDPAQDLPYLNFTSGYDNLHSCLLKSTVAQCGKTSGALPNDPQNSADIGRFYYDSGHFEAHAANDWSGVLGLSGLNAGGLGPAIAPVLHIDADHQIPNPNGGVPKNISVGLKYSGLVLAGDAQADANTYTSFLRQLLDGTLLLGGHLDDGAICTTGSACVYTSSRSGALPPMPDSDLDSGTPADGSPWQYALGHWIEKDGTYSSPGAFGFYPWIDSSKTWYGVVAEYSTLNELAYQKAVVCGRAIRNAWLNPPIP